MKSIIGGKWKTEISWNLSVLKMKLWLIIIYRQLLISSRDAGSLFPSKEKFTATIFYEQNLVGHSQMCACTVYFKNIEMKYEMNSWKRLYPQFQIACVLYVCACVCVVAHVRDVLCMGALEIRRFDSHYSWYFLFTRYKMYKSSYFHFHPSFSSFFLFFLFHSSL